MDCDNAHSLSYLLKSNRELLRWWVKEAPLQGNQLLLEERDMKTKITYEGKHVYMRLDVHSKSITSSCICDGVVVKRCRVPGSAEAFI